MTVLIFLDDVTPDNGPLEVVPGSHRSKIHTLWHDGVFTGAVDPEMEEGLRDASVSCTGKAGSACLMHSRLLHALTAKHDQCPTQPVHRHLCGRGCGALSPNPIPRIYDGDIMRGRHTGRVRCTPYEMDLPEYPKEASFLANRKR